MNKSNLTTVLKALYQFVMKRIGEVREAADKAQTAADKAQTAAGKAQTTADDILANLTRTTVADYEFNKSSITKLIAPVLTYVGTKAFASCDSLTVAYLPSVTIIMNSGFAYCGKLERVYISGHCSLQQGAFSGCSSLTALYIDGNKMAHGSGNILDNTPISNGSGYIYVPQSLVDSYTKDSIWASYANQIKGY